MLDVLIQACQEESAGSIRELLGFFLEECEIDQAPSREDIVQCRDVLLSRGAKFKGVAQICQQWLDDEDNV